MAGVSAFGTALDLIKNLNGVENAVQVKAAIAPLYDQVITAQSAQLQLIAKVQQLEAQIASMEQWTKEASRYALEEIPPGILVYRLRDEALNGEPPHRICPTCYQRNKKSLLHNCGTTRGQTRWQCHECGFDKLSGTYVRPPMPRLGGDW